MSLADICAHVESEGALEDLDFAGLEDRTLTLIMWWGYLRRSEAAQITVGDIRIDPRALGMYVDVRYRKTGVAHLVPVPAHRNQEGEPLATCALAAWIRYRDVYESHLGRPLVDSDPAFPVLLSGAR